MINERKKTVNKWTHCSFCIKKKLLFYCLNHTERISKFNAKLIFLLLLKNIHVHLLIIFNNLTQILRYILFIVSILNTFLSIFPHSHQKLFLSLIHRILLLLQWPLINFNHVHIQRCRPDRINLKLIAKTSAILSETWYRQTLDSLRQFALEQVYRVAEKNIRTHRSSLNNGVCIKYVSSRYREPTGLVNSPPVPL